MDQRLLLVDIIVVMIKRNKKENWVRWYVRYKLLSTLTYVNNRLTKSPKMLFESFCYLFIHVFWKYISYKNVSGNITRLFINNMIVLSLLNCVLYVFTCQRACVLKCSRANVPCVLTCSGANVPCMLTCPRANVPCVLSCTRANVFYVLTWYNYKITKISFQQQFFKNILAETIEWHTYIVCLSKSRKRFPLANLKLWPKKELVLFFFFFLFII